MGRPIDDHDREQVRRLHAAGKSRNEIAKAIKRSPSTVSKIAAAFEPPLTFDRAAEVAVATEVRRADLAARRSALALTLQRDAEQLRAQLWEPCTIGAFGGRDNVWSETHLERPTFQDQRAILAATGTAIDRSLKLAPAEGAEGVEQVRSMLGTLGEALTHAAGDDTDDGSADGGVSRCSTSTACPCPVSSCAALAKPPAVSTCGTGQCAPERPLRACSRSSSP
uniref:helix-turn-helix domain-containing protein n=1 Tax=Streptomyces polyasparticus TaxID=2767826 RepID=UPI001F224993|nr:helix-turn-helix domain-containing protein [Streptomyces polyasparticus]